MLILTVGWVGIRGGLAANAAVSGAGQAARIGSLLAEGNIAGARLAIPVLQAKAQEAAALTGDPIWRIVEAVPGVGGNLQTVRASFAAFSGVAGDGLGPLVDLSEGGAEELFSQPVAERRSSILRLTPDLTALDAALAAAVATVDDVTPGGTLPVLADAFGDARTSLRGYAAAAAAATRLSAVVPSLLSSEGEHSWTITVTADAAGGRGEVAVLLASTTEGRFVVTEVSSATGRPAVAPGAGSLSIDISAFPYLLEQTGPITVAGVGEVSAATVSDITATGVYAQAGSAPDADALVGAVAAELIGSLLN